MEDLTKEQKERILIQAETKFTKARVHLILDAPFFGTVAMHLQVKPTFELPTQTMAVDLYGNLYYDPRFVNVLNINELKYVLCHECLHLVCLHMTRKGEREHDRWGYAIDYAANDVLEESGIGKMPAGKHKGLYNKQFHEMTAEKIYTLLPTNGEGGGGDKSGNGGGDDSEGEDGGNSKDGSDGVSGGVGGWDEHIYGKGQSKVPLSDKEVKELEERWKQIASKAANTARMQGKLPGSLEHLIDGLLAPKVDWRTVLEQFIDKASKDDYRWYPQNRRHIHNGIYLPSLRSEAFEIAVAIDTSGSIGNEELAQFLSEVQSILDTSVGCTLHYYLCDAQVQKYYVYQSGDQIDRGIKGRGGTDFRGVFNDIKEKSLDVSALVYLTDTYGTFPDQPPENYNVLWVVVGNAEKIEVPFGDKIQLEIDS